MSDHLPSAAQPDDPAVPSSTGSRPGELLDRFVARLLDGIMLAIVYFVIFGLIVVSVGSGFVASAVSAVISAALYLGYFAYMESSRGQTVGKMVMKLHVVGPTGGKPELPEAIKRNIWAGFGVIGVIPLIGGVIGSLAGLAAVIVIAVTINGDTVKRQSWFDKFAGGTRVIKEG